MILVTVVIRFNEVGFVSILYLNLKFASGFYSYDWISFSNSEVTIDSTFVGYRSVSSVCFGLFGLLVFCLFVCLFSVDEF